MKIALVPLRTIVGDLEGNAEKILQQTELCAKKGAELVVFPELALLGYPPQDLLGRKSFLRAAEQQLDKLEAALKAKGLDKTGVLLGTLRAQETKGVRKLLNSAVLLHQGKRSWRYKTLIPAYDVFHESRFFSSGHDQEEKGPLEFKGLKLGILICEDSWNAMEQAGAKLYDISPTKALTQAGAELLINLSASPYEFEKAQARLDVLAAGAKEAKLPLLYVNYCGAQDELIFAGETYYLAADGTVLDKQDLFSSQPLFIDSEEKRRGSAVAFSQAEKLENLRQAIVCGIRDYAEKNRFQKVVLGISGGIDSALVAALAAEALGPQNVIGLSLPSKYSSSHSIEDAELLANNLGIVYKNFPIKFIHSTLHIGLKPYFGSLPEDITEENLQARLRGLVIMAFSNKFRALALATGNKSEFAVGYSTLYGDTCGALAPIGDLYKTQVYELARFINKYQEIIPANTLSKAPSAELRPNQTDQDSLPPYDVLDAILYQLVDCEADLEEAHAALKKQSVEAGPKLLREIATKVELSEYKRRQVPPIFKLSSKAFGMGRRYPLTAKLVP